MLRDMQKSSSQNITLVVVGGTAETSQVQCRELQAFSNGVIAGCITCLAETPKSDVEETIKPREPESVVIAVCNLGDGARDLARDLKKDGWKTKLFETKKQLLAIACELDDGGQL